MASVSSKPKGWFQRLKQGIQKSSKQLGSQVNTLLKHRKLDASTTQDLEDILLQGDLGVATTSQLMQRLHQQRFPTPFDPQEVQIFLAEQLYQILAPCEVPLAPAPQKGKPWVMLMVGVNGSGKTTTLGKLGYLWKTQGHRVRLVAGDTFRAAATAQLEVWAERADIPLQQATQGADAASLIYEAYQIACQKGDDLLLVDTAGRLQNKVDLMQELGKLVRVLKKQAPDAPHACVLVLDGTVGQNAFSQVGLFQKTVPLDGLIVTKLDGTAKGGVLVGLADAFRLPFYGIGVGESLEDFQPFDAKAFAYVLMGLEPPEAF